MLEKSYFLLSLLQAGLAQEWEANTPREVVAQEGSCAQIPCRYSYPSHLANLPPVGIWFNNEDQRTLPTVFHSKDHSRELARFRHRTQLSGDLKDGDCSLIINNITQEDAGSYYFRVEFVNVNSYSYRPATQLHVSDFKDKPTIFPEEIIAGKRVNLSCTFNTTCNGTAPVLTWDTPTAIPGSVSNTVTQHGVTLIYTSVLSLIPSPRHQGKTLTCRVSYPTVSSEQIFVLTVQYSPWNLTITFLRVVEDSLINSTDRNSKMIICSVESFPASNLTWSHLHVIMNRTSSNNELWLKLPYATYRKTGDYQCVAENEHGAVEGSITITVDRHAFGEWKAGLFGAGIALSVGLSAFFIFRCMRTARNTGRDHSAQTKHVGRDSPEEQLDKSRKDNKGQEIKSKLNSYVEEDLYENCKCDQGPVYGNV
ncbi:sialic acid-binding Ig-like lectin 13 isoform X2 [Hemiscyllium ocellatum]|uniref:sialic acid-binding Ig-like lectin 13 isoform X2 n=1 Tax=Hemiscyllium ocellatum TaxID=170820 RepID=UPI0029668FF2|nr:sialic acid-binding Ig-like lectin 13 isoform X2 [Hemiscyllium ocellatum]